MSSAICFNLDQSKILSSGNTSNDLHKQCLLLSGQNRNWQGCHPRKQLNLKEGLIRTETWVTLVVMATGAVFQKYAEKSARQAC